MVPEVRIHGLLEDLLRLFWGVLEFRVPWSNPLNPKPNTGNCHCVGGLKGGVFSIWLRGLWGFGFKSRVTCSETPEP